MRIEIAPQASTRSWVYTIELDERDILRLPGGTGVQGLLASEGDGTRRISSVLQGLALIASWLEEQLEKPDGESEGQDQAPQGS